MTYAMKTNGFHETNLIEKLKKATGNRTKKGALMDAAKFIVNDMPGLMKQLSDMRTKRKQKQHQEDQNQLSLNL